MCNTHSGFVFINLNHLLFCDLIPQYSALYAKSVWGYYHSSNLIQIYNIHKTKKTAILDVGFLFKHQNVFDLGCHAK